MKILKLYIYLTHSGDERSIKQRTAPEDLFRAQASSGSLQKHCAASTSACFLLCRKDRSPTSRPVLPPGKRQRRSRSVQSSGGGGLGKRVKSAGITNTGTRGKALPSKIQAHTSAVGFYRFYTILCIIFSPFSFYLHSIARFYMYREYLVNICKYEATERLYFEINTEMRRL